MNRTRKRLLKLVLISLAIAILERFVAVMSVVGMYNCTTLKCYQHDGSHTKLIFLDTLSFITAALFLLSLTIYVIYVIRKKPKKETLTT